MPEFANMNVAKEKRKAEARLDRAVLAAHRAGKRREAAATELGISVRTFIRRAKKLGLTRVVR